MKYLTTLEVANELKISKQTLLNWLYAKKVPEPPRPLPGEGSPGHRSRHIVEGNAPFLEE